MNFLENDLVIRCDTKNNKKFEEVQKKLFSKGFAWCSSKVRVLNLEYLGTTDYNSKKYLKELDYIWLLCRSKDKYFFYRAEEDELESGKKKLSFYLEISDDEFLNSFKTKRVNKI